MSGGSQGKKKKNKTVANFVWIALFYFKVKTTGSYHAQRNTEQNPILPLSSEICT